MAWRLLCATGNPGKLREFQLAAGAGIEIDAMGALPCPEDGATFEDNARAKALCYSRVAAAERAETPLVFADDSGLVVDALGGEPGVHSARYASGAGDAANNALLLEKLAGVAGEQRTARFVCVIALARGEQILGLFRGEAEGRILDRPVGSGGFGYDPLFFYPPLEKSFAELPPDVKWRHSHRGQAFREMLAWLRENLPEAAKL